MRTFLGFPSQLPDRPTYLTIGNFDGVHRGHQALIAGMVETAHAAGGLAGLLTFTPHPLAVLHPEIPLDYLTTVDERSEILAALGLDFVLILPFTRETAAISAASFMANLTQRLGLRELWIGPDFALGRGREGDASRLAALGREAGYAVRVAPPFDWQAEPVRSSRVRALLVEEGAVDRAAALLGRPYRIAGKVIAGARRGRRLGFPTANLAVSPERLAPAYGVYACWAWREDRGYPAVVNVGVRPSFDNGHPTIEAYLLDFDENLYGETLGLSFIQRLRGEKRFADIADLVAQIRSDTNAARRILADPPDQTGRWKLEAGGWRLEVGTPFWTELAHTADWAIRVTGDTQRQLFARAAASMFAMQDADRAHPITLAHAVNLVGQTDPAGLLVAWLNELLLEAELDGALYTRFEIHEISTTGLRAVAYGYPGAAAHTAIKAVTYYDLSVIETAGTWTATVTFDV